MVAESNTAYQQFSNPALLPLVKRTQLGLSYFSMSLDRSIQVLSFTQPLPPKASVALSVFRSATTDIIGKNSDNEFTQNCSVSEMFGMLSFGVSFSKSVSIGINLRTVINNLTELSQEISEYNANTFSMDLGAVIKLNKVIQIGIFGNNILGSYQWKENGNSSSYEEMFPKIWSIGSRYLLNNNVKFLTQVDLVPPPEQDMTTRFRGGVEYTYQENINIRLGLKQKYDSQLSKETIPFNFAPSLGFGIPITIWKNKLLNFDYSLDYGNENEGLSHLFSWTMEF